MLANRWVASPLELTRKNVLGKFDLGIPGHGQHLEDIPFDGQKFEFISGVPFTGSSAYLGGQSADGKPLLRSLFEYNTDHQLTPEEMPGHYLNSAVVDLRRRAGQLGFASA